LSNDPNNIDILLRAKIDQSSVNASKAVIEDLKARLTALQDIPKRQRTPVDDNEIASIKAAMKARREAMQIQLNEAKQFSQIVAGLDRARQADMRAAEQQNVAAARAAAQARQQAAREEQQAYKQMLRDRYEAVKAEYDLEKQFAKQQAGFAAAKQGPQMGWGVSFSQFLLGTAVRTLPGGREGMLDDILMGASGLNSVVGTIKQLSQEAGGLGNALKLVLVELGPTTVLFGGLSFAMTMLAKATEDQIKLEKELYEKRKESFAAEQKALVEGRTANPAEVRKTIAAKQAEQDALGIRILGTRSRLAGVQAQMDATNPHDVAQRSAQKAQIDNLNADLKVFQEAWDALDATITYNQKLLKPVADNWAAVNAVLAEAKQASEETVKWKEAERTASVKAAQQAQAALKDELAGLDAESLRIKRQQDARKALGIVEPEMDAALEARQKEIDVLRGTNAEATAHWQAIEKIAHARETELFVVNQQTKAYERHAKQIADAVKAQENAQDKVDKAQQDIAAAEFEHGKKLTRQREDDLTQQMRGGVEARYKRDIEAAKARDEEKDRTARIAKMRREAGQADAKAQREKDQQDDKALREYNERVEQINRDFMARELKAVDDFRREELRKQRDYAKEYLRFFEDWQDRLNALAADRDVAGFIQEQREGEKKLRRMAEDANEEAQRRAEDFAKQRQEATDNRAQDLADLRADYEQQRADRLADFEQARVDRLADLEQRIQDERDAAIKRRTEAQQLEDEFAAQREKWQRDDELRRRQIEEQDYAERMNALIKFKNDQAMIVASLMNDVYGNIPKSIAALGPAAADRYNDRKYMENRYAIGLGYVPHDYFPAYLDKGERVLTANENLAYMAGGRGGGSRPAVNLTIQYSTADLASKADVYAHGTELAQAVADTLRNL
jgi:DNA repair exonuclease SbcCD ATPase subunit